MSQPIDPRARRRFLSQTLMSLTAMKLGLLGTGLVSRNLLAASTRRRHLINIQAAGGWDSFWFHAAFPSEQARFNTGVFTDTPSGNQKIHNDTGGNLQEIRDSVTNDLVETNELLYTRRFADADGMNHPRRSDVFLGMGMKHAFGSAQSLLQDDVLIWRGITKDFDHGIGNQMVLHGALSAYALSYSSLIAQEIATSDYLRPLHYVQLTDTPAAFSSNWAMAKGPQVPINIASPTAFSTLTRPSPSEFSEQSIINRINSSVNQIGSSIGRNKFNLGGSRAIVDNFMRSFNGAIMISGTRIADSAQFNWYWKSYFLELVDSLNSLYSSGFASKITVPFKWQTLDDNVTKLSNAVSSMPASSPLQSWNSIKDAPPADPTLLASVRDFHTNYQTQRAKFAAGSMEQMWLDTAYNTAFNFAMADYLVTKDYAAVVDVPAPCTDSHDSGHVDLIFNLLAFVAYRKLLQNLKANGVLAKTTVVFFSELDRSPNVSTNVDKVNRGTNHGASTSCLLAGYGVQGGRVIGDIRSGPGGPYGGLGPLFGETSTFKYAWPLPINPTTGAVDPGNGILANSKHIFPTVMKIFGAKIPSSQLTGLDAITAALK